MIKPVPEPETTGPDLVIKEEVVVEIRDNGSEQDEGNGDEESAILSMIQVYQVADVPPAAPDTPCPTCATQGDASEEQSTDTEMTTAAVSLSLLYPPPIETALSSEMSQWLGPVLGTLPNLEQNVQESVSPLKQVDCNRLRDKSGRIRQDLGKAWSDVKEYEEQKSKVEETSKDRSRQDTGQRSSKRSQSWQ